MSSPTTAMDLSESVAHRYQNYTPSLVDDSLGGSMRNSGPKFPLSSSPPPQYIPSTGGFMPSPPTQYIPSTYYSPSPPSQFIPSSSFYPFSSYSQNPSGVLSSSPPYQPLPNAPMLPLTDNPLINPSENHRGRLLGRAKECMKKGDFQGAKHLIEAALEVDHESLGREHPTTMKALANLVKQTAGTPFYQPFITQSIGEMKGRLRELERTLGPTHEDTKRVRADACKLLSAAGRKAEAWELWHGDGGGIRGETVPGNSASFFNSIPLPRKQGNFY
jgi:hypothetical protein